MAGEDAKRPAEEETSVKSQTDRISVLPHDILTSIISRCTVRDVVNTSLLSRRWRHLRSAMSTLSFHWYSMFEDCNTSIFTWLRDERDLCPHFKERFVKGVNQFLQFYKGSQLQLECFRISFCLGKEYFDDIDQWVRFAVSMGVKQLSLRLACGLTLVNESQPQDIQLYILRSELFSEGNVTKLQQLYLHSCILGPSVIHQFSSLRILVFVRVHLGNLEVESILSSCLDLESMSLENCVLPLKLCISDSLPRLKFLSVQFCRGVEEIYLSAATLTRFEYAGCMIKFSVSGLPNLQEVYLRLLDEKGMKYVFNQLGKDLPMVKTLSVFAETNWVHCIPEHVTTFSNVKKLEFFCLRGREFYALKMIQILNSCPLLEKLYIVRSPVWCSQIIKEMRVPSKSVHKHLKEVHMGGFHLRLGYIEFALYMIEYAAVLERMIIDPALKACIGLNHWLCTKRWTWDEGEREAVCARLKGCSKSFVILIL